MPCFTRSLILWLIPFSDVVYHSPPHSQHLPCPPTFRVPLSLSVPVIHLLHSTAQFPVHLSFISPLLVCHWVVSAPVTHSSLHHCLVQPSSHLSLLWALDSVSITGSISFISISTVVFINVFILLSSILSLLHITNSPIWYFSHSPTILPFLKKNPSVFPVSAPPHLHPLSIIMFLISHVHWPLVTMSSLHLLLIPLSALVIILSSKHMSSKHIHTPATCSLMLTCIQGLLYAH